MRSISFRNIRITDCDRSYVSNLLIRDGKVAAIGPAAFEADTVIEGAGRTLMPSFVDLHVHFRDPGFPAKEDIHSGCIAAVHGGYGVVNLMANTKPVCSTMATVRYVRDKAAALSICDVYQCVSVTKDFDGKTLSHLDDLDGSVRWISEDGYGVQDTGVMLEAMRKAKALDIGIMLHEEDAALTKVDSYLMEELMTFRDTQLARLTGCRTHFSHVSTINSMRYIIEAKKECPSITCEVTPHHLALNDTHSGKVAPPLRGEEHRRFLIECIQNGQVDAIATDHAPHTAEDKKSGANGFTGLDLAFPICYTYLVKERLIPIEKLSELLSRSPARLMGLEHGVISVGCPADVVLVDLDKPFVADEGCIHSRSKNSPFLGQTLCGKIVMTIRKGTIVYEENAD